METDRELLERAARAAGYPVERYTWSKGTQFEHQGFRYDCELERVGEDEWNPLEDDGQALRLAVKLRMFIDVTAEASGAQVAGLSFCSELNGADSCAATRRAIVRAAAMLEGGQG